MQFIELFSFFAFRYIRGLARGIQYFRIFVILFLFMILLYTIGHRYRGMGKTYPSLVEATLDNLLFAGFVVTLPVYFNWTKFQ